MTAKITTEDCVAALTSAFPAEFGPDSGNWKRVSKAGKKGEPIVRVFYHRALPLKGIVTEVKGAISDVTFKGVGSWDLDPESEVDNAMEAVVSTNAAWTFLETHDLFKPSDFVFYVSPTNDDGDETWYVLTPISYFKREGAQYDDQLDFVIARHLPEGDGEATEATFVTDRKPDEVRADLLARGFVQDPAFDAMFADS